MPLPVYSGTAPNQEIGDIDQTELCRPVQWGAARPIECLNLRPMLNQDTRHFGVRGEVKWRVKPLGTTSIDGGSPRIRTRAILRQPPSGRTMKGSLSHPAGGIDIPPAVKEAFKFLGGCLLVQPGAVHQDSPQ